MSGDEVDLCWHRQPRGHPLVSATVPRFYFHLHNDVDATDPEGAELPDLEAAHRRAQEQARFTLAQTAMDEGKINLAHRIDIEDEHGRVLDTVWFRDAVRIEDGQ